MTTRPLLPWTYTVLGLHALSSRPAPRARHGTTRPDQAHAKTEELEQRAQHSRPQRLARRTSRATLRRLRRTHATASPQRVDRPALSLDPVAAQAGPLWPPSPLTGAICTQATVRDRLLRLVDPLLGGGRPPFPRLGPIALGTLAAGVVGALQASLRPGAVTPYKAPQYWLTYDGGFVRRGLPGHLLSQVTGGAPTLAQVQVAGTCLSVAAALSVVPVAWGAASRSAGEPPAVLVLVVLLTSPLSVSLLLHDRGRFDGVGVLAVAALAGFPRLWLRLPVGVSAGMVAALVATACASEEFLLGLVAPVALARAALLAEHRGYGRSAARLFGALVLAPGVAVTLASALLPPAHRAVAAARRETRRQGIGPDPQLGDALDAVARNVVENLAFFRLFAPAATAGGLLLWSGFYALTAALLGSLLAPGGREYRRAAGYFAAFAAGLSALGVDFRRWWGLALLGLTATVAVTPPPLDLAPSPRSRALRGSRALRVGAAAAGLAVAGLLARDVTVYPRTGL